VAAGEGAACAVINARISDRTLRRYLRLRWLLARPLASLSCVLARSPEDARRFVALGARAERTRVIGDLKLAGAAAPAPDALRRALGPGPLWVAGSTHPGEERALLEAWQALRAAAAPALRLVLVPRHTERAAQVRAEAERLGIEAALRSSERAAAAPVVVVDSVGELAALYGLAELVFVGGSLVPQGGHNLFEPLRAGKVALCGPHLHNQRSQTELLAGTQALLVVADEAALRAELQRHWLAADRHAPARAARERLFAGGHALEEILAWIAGARAGRGLSDARAG
jgi:3-deoxy-D-manno-octulosonic-acid transferase